MHLTYLAWAFHQLVMRFAQLIESIWDILTWRRQHFDFTLDVEVLHRLRLVTFRLWLGIFPLTFSVLGGKGWRELLFNLPFCRFL